LDRWMEILLLRHRIYDRSTGSLKMDWQRSLDTLSFAAWKELRKRDPGIGTEIFVYYLACYSSHFLLYY